MRINEEQSQRASRRVGNSASDKLIADHIPLVGYVVNEIAAKVPSHVRREDLTSAGLVGLVQAASGFDATRGVPFSRYATTRIRGSIVDELRSGDWVSRSVRSKARQKEEASSQLAATLGRTPTTQEVADFLGVPVSQIEAVEEDLHRSVILRIDAEGESGSLDSVLPSPEATPEEQMIRRERIGYLKDAVAALPERLRVVVEMYFLEGRPMAEIAETLNVSESRISQMRAEALVLMRDGINAQLDPERLTGGNRPGGCVERRRAQYFSAIAERSTFANRLAPLPEESTGSITRLA